MKIKCEYCGGWLQDTDLTCPNCGGTNKNLKRFTDTTPKTIEELKKWYQDRHLPPSYVTRFYIGENYKGAKAFGIYKDPDSGDFIVYKNKADGSRAIRYQGDDEAYAVNEIYLKLKSEILNQKSMPANRATVSHPKKRSGNQSILSNFEIILYCILTTAAFGILPLIGILMVVVPIVYLCIKDNPKIQNSPFMQKFNPGAKANKVVTRIAFWLILILVASLLTNSVSPKYYNYNGSIYCKYNDKYYEYSNNDYAPVSYYDLPSSLLDNWSFYEFSTTDGDWDSSYSFYSSDYYEDVYSYSSGSSSYSSDSSWDSGWDSGWDSDYDWDSGDSWDFGGSDWDSDW